MLVYCKRSVYLRLVYSDLRIYLYVCYDSRDFGPDSSVVNRKYTENMYIYHVSCHKNRFTLFLTGFKYVVLTNYKSTGTRRAKASNPDAMHVPPNLLECGPVRLSFAFLIKFYHSLNLGSARD